MALKHFMKHLTKFLLKIDDLLWTFMVYIYCIMLYLIQFFFRGLWFMPGFVYNKCIILVHGKEMFSLWLEV